MAAGHIVQCSNRVDCGEITNVLGLVFGGKADWREEIFTSLRNELIEVHKLLSEGSCLVEADMLDSASENNLVGGDAVDVLTLQFV